MEHLAVSEAIGMIAHDLIENCKEFEAIKVYEPAIAYIESDRRRKRAGGSVFGECKKVSAKMKMFANYDYIITIYTANCENLTMEQLRQHDEVLLREHTEQIIKKAHAAADAKYDENMKGATKIIEDEWRMRQEAFMAASPEDRFLNWMQYLLCVSCRVLVEKFGWKPLNDDEYDGRRNLLRFANFVKDEINVICSDEMLDIRAYAKETYEKCGIRFDIDAEEE